MSRIVTAGDWADFDAELNKDLVRVGHQTERNTFCKHVMSPDVAAAEYAALQRLARLPGEVLAPAPLSLQQDEIEMTLVEGIRVYDLIRFALTVPGGVQAAEILMGRMRTRLRRIGAALSEPSWPVVPYPFDRKVIVTLELLSRILELPSIDPGERDELNALNEYWNASVSVPFRDAVLKNVLVADDRLGVAHGHSAQHRAVLLADILASEPQYAHTIAMRDVDFSSVIHLTTPEDDWVSLQLFELSTRVVSIDDVQWPESYVARRAALTALVRYLRFGGRKMAYCLLMPHAASTRYAFDDPSYYLARLPSLLDHLDPTFTAEFPRVIQRCDSILRAFVTDARARPGARTTSQGFWQESPLEVACRALT